MTWTRVVAALVACPADGKDELRRRVVEVQLDAQLAVVGLHVEGLVLGDEHLKMVGGKAFSLGILQEHICDFHARLEVRRCQAARRGGVLDGNVGRRDDDTVGKLGKIHVHLDAMELQTGKREGIAGVLAVPKGERHIEGAGLARVAHERFLSVSAKKANAAMNE